MEFNKLVRDRIPELIQLQGENPIFKVLESNEYLRCLERKLDEEVSEYHESKALDELADILEVLFALTEANGYSKDELFSAYQTKHEQCGGFSERIFLISKQ